MPWYGFAMEFHLEKLNVKSFHLSSYELDTDNWTRDTSKGTNSMIAKLEEKQFIN